MRIIYTLLALLLAFGASAQQNVQYSQYIFNSMAINPAYTGSKNVLNANIFHRSQWAGIEGAPSVQSLAVDGIPFSDRLGLGLDLTRTSIGAHTRISAYANAAVKMPVSENGVLSLGLAAGLVQNSIDGAALGIFDDPSIPATSDNSIKPNIRLGLYYHNTRFYAGVSAAEIVQYKEVQNLNPLTHYYFTTGYVFDVGSFVKLKPSILVQENFNAPTNIDLNAFVLLDEKLWLGTSYRTSANLFNRDTEGLPLNRPTAIALIAELQVTKALRVGYSFDRMLNDMKGYNAHEVSVGYYFLNPKKDPKMVSPQYF